MEQFDHIGPLCKVIRRGQLGSPNTKQMGRACGYRGKDPAQMIRRFENGDIVLEEPKFKNLYVPALGLLPAQAEQLKQMYDSYLHKNADEARLRHYSFRTIKEEKHPQLDKLVNQLQETTLPAVIHDELLYFHAMNAPFLKLYNVPTEFLWLPVWHAIAPKYYRGEDHPSPVRKAHEGYEDYFFEYEAARFFEGTCKYVFTQQMKSLVNFLCQLSPDEFQPHWESLLTMHRIPRTKDAIRPFRYRDEKIDTSMAIQEPPTEIKTEGQTLKYSLAWLLIQGKDAKKLHEEIAKDTVGNPVEFATKYVPDYNEKEWSELLPV